MHVFLYSQGCSFLFHLHAYHDIEVFGLGGSLFVIFATHIEFGFVCVFDIVASVLGIEGFVYACADEVVVEFINSIVFSLEINHRSGFTFFIYKEERRNTSILCYLGIVGTECWSDMHDASTVICGHIVTRDDTESAVCHFHECVFSVFATEHLVWMLFSIIFHEGGSIVVYFGGWFYPRHELVEFHAYQFFACIMANDTVWHHLVAWFEILHISILAFRFEVGINTGFCHHHGNLLCIIGVVCLYGHIADVWSHAESGI